MDAGIRHEVRFSIVQNISLVQIRRDDSGVLALFQSAWERAFALWAFATNCLTGPERHSLYRGSLNAKA